MGMMHIRGQGADSYLRFFHSDRKSKPSKEKVEECAPSSSNASFVVEEPQGSSSEQHPLERRILTFALWPEGAEKELYTAALKEWMGKVLQKIQLPKERIDEILQKEENHNSFFYIAQHGIHFMRPGSFSSHNQRNQAWGAAVKVLELPIETLDPFRSFSFDSLDRSEDQKQVIALLKAAHDVKVK